MAKSMDIPQEIIVNIIAAVGDVTRLLKQCSLVFPSLKQELRSEATNLARGFTKFSSKIQPLIPSSEPLLSLSTSTVRISKFSSASG